MFLLVQNKQFNVLEQMRMICLLIYIIGAMLFLLKHYKVIKKHYIINLNVVSNWLVSLSVILFLVLSSIKIINYFIESVDHQKQRLLMHTHETNCNEISDIEMFKSERKINIITAIRYISNSVFVCVCIVSGSLLLLLNYSYIHKSLILNVYSIMLIIGASLAGLYFITRFLVAYLGICNHLIDNMNTRNTKCNATDFIVSKIDNQLSILF